MTYSAGVERAIQVCLEAHAGQFRKGGHAVPYAVHPIHMALILGRADVNEVLIQAALLHDVVEDCEGWTMTRLRAEFGEDVADVVDELTEDKSKSWQERKQWALEHVAHMSEASATVKAADKIHNLENLAAQLAAAQDTKDVWGFFTGGRERTLEMDKKLVLALRQRVPNALAAMLDEALARVERLA